MVLTLYKGEKLVRSNSRAATTHLINYTNTVVSSSIKKKEIRWGIGSILLAAGCIFWSSWFLLQARIGKTYPCQYSSTAILSFFSAIQSAILSLVTERDFTKWFLKEKLELITVTYSVSVVIKRFGLFDKKLFFSIRPFMVIFLSLLYYTECAT